MLLFSRIKKISLAVILILSMMVPMGQPTQAYNSTESHETVLDIGKRHFVVLKSDGSVWSWGDDTYGQLGVLGNGNTPSAIRLSGGHRLDNIKSIAAGGNHTIALDNNNEVWTWGQNSNGQLGYDTGFKPNNDPRKVTIGGAPLKAVSISAGEFHSLAVSPTGEVYAWGSGLFGQNGTTADFIEPKLVSGLSNIVAVAAGANHSVALSATGEVYAWGRGTNGQLGNGQSGHINAVPTKVNRINKIMSIAAGDNHTVALAQDRTTVWAWGSNAYGQIGDGGLQDRLNPTTVEGLKDVKRIATGNDHTIAIKDDGTVWTWGRNTSGTQTVRTTPIQIKGVNNALAIGGGGSNMNSYTIALNGDGTIWKWDEISSDSFSRLPIFKQVHGIDDVMKKVSYPFVQGGEVVFKYTDPAAVDVKVAGSFNNWVDLPLTKNGNDWTIQTKLPTGKYEYGFKVNGVWTTDPLNPDRGISQGGDPINYLTVDSYATETPVIKNRDVTFTYSSYDYNGQFEFDAETNYVAVRGSFNDWVEIPMTKQRNNVWTTTKTLPPGSYYYEFVVRDRDTGTLTEQRLDPLNPNVATMPNTNSKRNVFAVEEQLPTKVPVEEVTIDRAPEFEMVVGEEIFLRANIKPANATDKTISWRSAKPTIATVDATGKVIAYAEGTTTIVATSVTDGSKMDFVTVIVKKQDGAVHYPRAGYVEKGPANTTVDPDKVWYVTFSEAVDLISGYQNDHITVLDQAGRRMPIALKLNDRDEKILEIRLQSGYNYERGETYYLFIEDGVKTKYSQKKLKDKVQMKFQIKL